MIESPLSRALLYVPAKLYELVVRARVAAYRNNLLKTHRLNAPVISVGNLTVGGTGKTPCVAFIAAILRDAGHRAAILSRGYKRQTTGRVEVSNHKQILCSPAESGDEPYLLAQSCPGVRVVVDRDRVAAGRWLESQAPVSDFGLPVSVFVLDDAYQHLRLARDLNLLLVDATDSAGLRAALPVGRLREPLSAAARASAILITRVDEDQEGESVRRLLLDACGSLPSLVRVGFRAEEYRRVGKGERHPLDAFRGRSALLFSGIGNAESFRALVDGLGITVIEMLAFPDHVHFTRDMLDTIRAKAKAGGADLLVTTEKDADKVALLLGAEEACWAVRLRTEIVSGQEELERLLRLGSAPGRMAGHA